MADTVDARVLRRRIRAMVEVEVPEDGRGGWVRVGNLYWDWYNPREEAMRRAEQLRYELTKGLVD